MAKMMMRKATQTLGSWIACGLIYRNWSIRVGSHRQSKRVLNKSNATYPDNWTEATLLIVALQASSWKEPNIGQHTQPPITIEAEEKEKDNRERRHREKAKWKYRPFWRKRKASYRNAILID